MRFAPLLVSACLLPAAAAKVEFNRDVRPILSDKCFACHGPDAKTKGVPLRLDDEKLAKNGKAIVPGNPEASTVIQRVTETKAARRMPPAFTGHVLTAAEVATLKQWISEGAEWQKHWAYLPPRATPGATIDSLISARLAKEGWKLSERAPRETLIRRVSFDLTGLPPTVAEVEAFVNDPAPDAYEKLVDRLLASPRYGERMAARWLDAARYADTNGYQYDGERVMWRWRDWVIEAFNRNQPYDQFALEQLAGDLLPNATLAQKIATGFNRNHRGNTEDGIVPEEYAVEYVVDRVETTAAVFLGLTMGCARCHNHKYDPITQRDFYRFFAYFNNVPESGRAMKYGNSPPYVAAPTEEQQKKLAVLDERIARERAALAKIATAPGAHGAWVPTCGLEPQPMGHYDIRDHFTISARVAPGDGPVITKGNKTYKAKGYGVWLREGKLHVNIVSVWESDAIKVEADFKPEREFHLAVTYDGSVAAAGVKVYVDGQPLPLKVTQDNLYRPFVNAGAAYRLPLEISPRTKDVRLYGRVLEDDERLALAMPEAKPEFARQAFLAKAAPETVARLDAARLERDRFVRSFPTVMVMAELSQRRPTHLLLRGQYDKPGEPVEPGLPGLFEAPAAGDRLGMARWLASRENPLVARVAVNRFWQMLFGTGLVKTTEDFGQQGEWPSHPELLDTLAVEFMDSGWDVKRLLKKIVTSATYQQSAKATPAMLERDPDNRLLARGPRVRLAAEMIRDNALTVSGLLTQKVGGPSVKPYQPDGLWKEVIMQDMDYVRAKNEDLYRRSLYTFWKRTVAPPMMANFDAANRETCVVRESRTNTPLQALNLMNDVTFLEAARVLAERMMAAGPSPEERLRYGFRAATARGPAAREQEVLLGSLRHHLDYFADEAKAKAFLAQGDRPVNGNLPARELAAYSAVASLILNLDEVVTKP